MLKEKLMDVVHGQEGWSMGSSLLVAGSSLLIAAGLYPWDSGAPPAGDLTEVFPTLAPIPTPARTLTRILATSSPEPSATAISSLTADPLVRRTAAEEEAEATWMKNGIKACFPPQVQVSARPSRGSVFLLDGVLNGLRGLSGLFVQTAEAGPLEAEPKTFEQFILCIQAIEQQRPFLTSEQQARKFNFKKIDVTKWKAENVLGLDSIANWQKSLLDEVRKRGYNVSQAQINAFLADTRRVTFINPAGLVQMGHIDSRRPETLIWIAVDPDTKQLVFALEKCDNVGVPISLETPPTPTPETPSPTPVPPTPTPETPSPTPVPPTPTPETPSPTPVPPTPVPTNTHAPIPTATRTVENTPTPVPPTPSPIPTNTHAPIPTATRTPNTPTPFPTVTPLAIPTFTPIPTNTHAPIPTATRTVPPTPTPISGS